MNAGYAHFQTAIYATVYDVQRMADLDGLRASFERIRRGLHVDKVYLETHRDTVVADEETIRGARAFFEGQGVRTAGGITLTVNERNRFQTYCYTRPEQRDQVRQIVAYTARLFDEFILDDFFFTNCKCPACIAAKGEQSWSAFRLALMTEAAQSLVIGPARAANPRVEAVIKYPNWYEHFAGLGFNLEAEPPLFDGIYTGTETRDPVFSNQHLQPYQGYAIVRYLENIKPGGNRGGWVDPFGSRYLDRYAEQLWLTLLAGAPEITLFHYGQMERALEPAQRAPWQGRRAAGEGIGLDFDGMIASLGDEVDPRDKGTWSADATLALAAGHAFERIDLVLGLVGRPLGVPSYKPYHSHGEDYLHNYLGMLGIPIDMVPEFPAAAQTVLLTAAARFDLQVVEKIQQHLLAGKTVVVTSGLFQALQERGLRDIVELEVTGRKASVQDFLLGWFQVAHSEAPILVPHIDYMTNDSWEEISGLTRTTGHPILHSAAYGGGTLYMLTVPDNFDDLYRLPAEVLARIRAVLMGDLYVRLDAPAQVALLVYDNRTWIAASFLPEAAEVRMILDQRAGAPVDALSGETFAGEPIRDWRDQPTGQVAYRARVGPHAFRVFHCPPRTDQGGSR